MVDVCRHFLTVDEMKKHIDIISMFKINSSIGTLPMTRAGVLRSRSIPALLRSVLGRIEGDGSRYGGFYTQDQVREIVRYAQDRFVTIIPEIEMPGHGYGCYRLLP